VSRRFIGAFFPDAEFRETRAVIRVDAKADAAPAGAAPLPDDDFLQKTPPVPDRYVARGRVRIRAGWQDVAGFSDSPRERPSPSGNNEPEGDDEPEAERDKAQVLPPLTVDMRLRGDFTVRAKKTRPPPRYSEASLLAAMDGAGKKLTDETLRAAMSDHGLGTPATRAAIIETLLDRGYVVRQGKLLVPTDLGLDLIGSLPVPGLCSAELTGKWEARLARLARGDDGARAFMADIAAYVRELVDAVRSAPPQPPLSPPTSRRAADKTPARRTRAGTKRPTTRRATAEPTKRAPVRKTAERKTTERKTAERKTAERKTPVRKTSSRRRREEAPSVESRSTLPAPGTPVEPKVICPLCRQSHLLWGRRAWGCANFRVCSLVISYENDGQTLSEVDLRRICAARRMTDSNGAASVAGDRQLAKS